MVRNIFHSPPQKILHPYKRFAGNPVFTDNYRAQMQIPLKPNPMRTTIYRPQVVPARLAAIQTIQQGQWFNQPLMSIINNQLKPSGDIEHTIASLTHEASGAKHILSTADFSIWLSQTKTLQQQRLVVDIKKIQALNLALNLFCVQQQTPEAIGKVLAEVFVDFNAEKSAELDERFDTEQRHTALCRKSIDDLVSGDLQYGVSAAGVVIAPVVNFGSLLDVQQKTIHALRHGIKVTWLVRQGEAAQQVTREVLRLHALLAQHDVADMLDIVVLSVAQRDQFFKTIGLPTLATGRADSMIAIQQAAPDSSTSGSGNSADMSLDADISLSARFANMVMRDAAVAGNGRQCTALQVAIINALPKKFAELTAQQFTLHTTPQQANQTAFDHDQWYAAFASTAPSLPEGTTQLPVEHDSLAFYDASQQLLGEEATWGKLGIGIINTDKLSVIVNYVQHYPWLSIGYVPNMADIEKEVSNFLAILQASKATVGTFNGPCVFSAPQHPGEVFAESTTHRQGKLIISHSPMQAPVPRGPQLWGPSADYLLNKSNQASALTQQLAHTFTLNSAELGYLVEMQQYLQDAARPHLYDRENRGPSIEGFAIRSTDDPVSKYIPAQCYLLKNAITALDIAVGLLLLTQTNWQGCTDALLIHSSHQPFFASIEQFLHDQHFQGQIRVCDDPQTANTTEVEAFPSTRFHAHNTFRQVDDVIATFGARMMHLKFLNAPNTNAAAIFKQQSANNFPWLRSAMTTSTE